MNHTKDLMAQIDALFHPKSISVVGVPREMKTGKLFLMAFQDQGFPGPIYPVNPQAEEIDGLKTYPSVSAIPGPVDLAVILVPNHHALSVLRECAAKGVKGAVLFTAGYKETGTDEGKALEEELVRVARSSGMRLVGPNCMGLYSPKTGLSFFPELSREPGFVGVISQSGSLANILCKVGAEKGIRFSKVVSLGNESDLTSAEFLTYLGKDSDTRLIGVYLEGIKDGPFFLNALREASLEKPVIIWKAGLTSEGNRAVASHTGALAGSREIWEGMVQQGGSIPVVGFEAWMDALIGFSLLAPFRTGRRIAIISGPGGLAVSAADACGSRGLELAKLSPQTQTVLTKIIPPTGTSIGNPIDVGLTASMEIEIYTQAAWAVASDSGVDAVMIIGRGMSEEANRKYLESMIQTRKKFKKPFIIVNIPGFGSDLSRLFLDAGFPVFETTERAMQTYARVLRYRLWRERMKS